MRECKLGKSVRQTRNKRGKPGELSTSGTFFLICMTPGSDWSIKPAARLCEPVLSLKKNVNRLLLILCFVFSQYNAGKDGTDPHEKDWDAETTRVEEKEWFAGHPQYKDSQHVCGIDRLMDTMISLLAEKMITEIPILVRHMKERKREVRKLLARIYY